MKTYKESISEILTTNRPLTIKNYRMNFKFDWDTLILKYAKGTITDEELTELNARIAADPAKKKEFKLLTNFDSLMAEVKESNNKIAQFNKIDPKKAWEKFKKSIAK